MILKLLRKIFWYPLVLILRPRFNPDWEYHQPSFSQDGEDVVMMSLFRVVPPVARFYVDVGAYHPKRFSNTYLFYRQGWRGINIDAMPGSMSSFKEARPRDINVEAAIALKPGLVTYHMFKEQGLNTLSSDIARLREAALSNPLCEKQGTYQVRSQTLTQTLDTHLPPGQKIGFLTVDVEGLDLEVLQSLDFNKYRAHYILAEHKQLNGAEIGGDDPILHFLGSLGYRRVAMTYRTSIFIDSTSSSKAMT